MPQLRVAVLMLCLNACAAQRLLDEIPDGGADLAVEGSGGSDGGGPCLGRFCQVPSCPSGSTTTLSGVLYAGNGTDPVPGAMVFIPIEGVPTVPTGLSCDTCSSVPSSVSGATTGPDGSFVLSGVPAGSFPLVLRLGKFQRVVKVQANPCVQNSVPPDPDTASMGVRLPRKQGELSPQDYLPHIAVGSGDYDQIECVLQRIGIDESAIDMYNDRNLGTTNPPSIAELSDLLTDQNRLFGYDILIVNCTENQYESLIAQSSVKQNLESFVRQGGRLYITDWAYDVIEQIPQFANYLCFEPQSPPGPAMCLAGSQPAASADSGDNYGGESQVLDPNMAKWLTQFPGVISAGNQVDVEYSFVVVASVSSDASAQSKVWVQGPTIGFGTRPLTVTFDYQGCGRVHFSTYNTEPNGIVNDSQRWPNNCQPQFSPQERLLEYLFFNVAACVGPPPG
jgi:hypothetical protein